jgi:ribonuclease-3
MAPDTAGRPVLATHRVSFDVALDAFEAHIGHRFTNRVIIEQALSHASAVDSGRATISYERLEFVGDRVLGLVAALVLSETYPAADEGGLSVRLNAVVAAPACARAARRAGIPTVLRLSRDEERKGGRDKERILGDAAEAVCAALFFDAGLPAARRFVETFWAEEFARVTTRPRDPKNTLQEWAAASGRSTPMYRVVRREGPDHAPRFQVEVAVSGAQPGLGEGASKRDAERAAARALLREAGENVDE